MFWFDTLEVSGYSANDIAVKSDKVHRHFKTPYDQPKNLLWPQESPGVPPAYHVDILPYR
jgi:hypothetical protein